MKKSTDSIPNEKSSSSSNYGGSGGDKKSSNRRDEESQRSPREVLGHSIEVNQETTTPVLAKTFTIVEDATKDNITMNRSQTLVTLLEDNEASPNK